MIANAAGAVVAETRYLPYGQAYWQWGASQTDFGFTGQRMDGFGLMDYNARYYDPLLGRFISPDSIIPQPGSPLPWDRYGYASNDPINYIDPSGHKSCESDTENVDECKYVSTYTPSPYFFRLPVAGDSIEWIQWFGGTEFAYLDHQNHQAGKANWIMMVIVEDIMVVSIWAQI